MFVFQLMISLMLQFGGKIFEFFIIEKVVEYIQQKDAITGAAISCHRRYGVFVPYLV